MSDAELDRETLLRLLEDERAARRRLEQSLRAHSTELSLAADELMNQADALYERDMLASQMAIARRIQLAVFPPPVRTLDYDVACAMDTADDVGGDFCDVLVRGETLWLAIGDVTGHGIDAGLMMLMAQSAFSLATEALPDAGPLDILGHVNRVLYQNIRRRMQRTDHMTFLSLRAAPNGRMRYAGGHDLDLLVVGSDGSVREHEATGMWLGARAEIEHTHELDVELTPGDLFVLATDGLTDSANADGIAYGLDRFVDTLVRERTSAPETIVEATRANVLAWRTGGKKRRLDDMTMIVARYRGA